MVSIDEYTELDKMYLSNRNTVDNEESFTTFKEKWKNIFPEIVLEKTNYHTFSLLKNSQELQCVFVNRGDSLSFTYINLLLPYQLVKLILIARKYIVTTGLVYIQLNGGFR